MTPSTAPTLQIRNRQDQDGRDEQVECRVTSGIKQELEEPRIVFDSRTRLWGLEPTECSTTDGESGSKVDRNDIYQPCFAAGDKLIRMANKYREKLNLPTEDITTVHSWTEVEKELQSAYSALEGLASRDKDFSGSMGKLKRAFRGLCQHARAGQTFVSLVPNDGLGLSSILCGGLKIIFTGLSETALYREEVYKALEELPYTLTDHAVNVNISLYGDDDELHRRTASLYVSIFRLLEHLVGWFVKNSFVTGVRLLLDPSRFSEKLNEKLAGIKLASQKWEHRASLLSKQHQNEALQLQYWNTLSQTRMVRDMQTILNRTEGLEDKISRTTILESLNPFVQVVVDELEKRLESSHYSRLPSTQSLSSNKTRSQILTKFLYEPDLLPSDCEVLIKILHTSNRPSSRTKLDTNRIAALQSNPCIRAWLTVDESSLLLLNGRTANPKSASETSIVVAQIVHRLLEWRDHPTSSSTSTSTTPPIIPLAFFCSQHRDQTLDPNANPAEATMSLLLQLIDQHPSLPPDLLTSTLEDTNPEDLYSILSSLSNLILNGLPSNTILVLILDGLTFFTQPTPRRDQTRELVDGLVDIYRVATRRDTTGSRGNRSSTNPTLKFLFSSPTRSDFIEDLFYSHETAALPRDLPKLVSADTARRERLELEFPGGGGSRGSEGDVGSDSSECN